MDQVHKDLLTPGLLQQMTNTGRDNGPGPQGSVDTRLATSNIMHQFLQVLRDHSHPLTSSFLGLLPDSTGNG